MSCSKSRQLLTHRSEQAFRSASFVYQPFELGNVLVHKGSANSTSAERSIRGSKRGADFSGEIGDHQRCQHRQEDQVGTGSTTVNCLPGKGDVGEGHIGRSAGRPTRTKESCRGFAEVNLGAGNRRLTKNGP